MFSGHSRSSLTSSWLQYQVHTLATESKQSEIFRPVQSGYTISLMKVFAQDFPSGGIPSPNFCQHEAATSCRMSQCADVGNWPWPSSRLLSCIPLAVEGCPRRQRQDEPKVTDGCWSAGARQAFPLPDCLSVCLCLSFTSSLASLTITLPAAVLMVTLSAKSEGLGFFFFPSLPPSAILAGGHARALPGTSGRLIASRPAP